MALNHRGYRPQLLEWLVKLAAHASFAPVARMARLLLETDVSDVQLGELVGEVGRANESRPKPMAGGTWRRLLKLPQPPINLGAVLAMVDGSKSEPWGRMLVSV